MEEYNGCSVPQYTRYPSDRHLMHGCWKGIAGSRVILQIMLEYNMVEVECPLCAKTVDLGSDSTGAYECPYCNEDFEYFSSVFPPMGKYDSPSPRKNHRQIISEIESGDLTPDFVIHESTMISPWYERIIGLLVSILFIPIIVGLVWIYNILENGITTQRTLFKTVFISELDLVLSYKTNNGETVDLKYFVIGNNTRIEYETAYSDGSVGGGANVTIITPGGRRERAFDWDTRIGKPMWGIGNRSYWKEFAQYRNIQYIKN